MEKADDVEMSHGRFCCYLCVDSRFKEEQELNAHLRDVHVPRTDKPLNHFRFQCPDCRLTFDTLIALNSHCSTHDRGRAARPLSSSQLLPA